MRCGWCKKERVDVAHVAQCRRAYTTPADVVAANGRKALLRLRNQLKPRVRRYYRFTLTMTSDQDPIDVLVGLQQSVGRLGDLHIQEIAEDDNQTERQDHEPPSR